MTSRPVVILASNSNKPWREKFDDLLTKVSGPPEQGGRGLSAPSPQRFLSMCPFSRRAVEVPFLKEVTKNVHEN